MSLSYRQENQLRRIGVGLRRSDPHLNAMFAIFGKLYPDQDMPAWEQVPQVSSSQDRLYRAAASSVTVLIATVAAIIVIAATVIALFCTVAVAAAGWRVRGTGRHARTYPPSLGSDARHDADRDQDQGRADDGLRRPDELA